MIKKIEQLRVKAKISKAKLARESGISTAQYYNYLRTDNVPYHVIENMVQFLGYELIITIKV